MRLARMLAVLAALLTMGLGPPAVACTCMAHPADEAKAVAAAWSQADAIFLGKVTAIKSGFPGLGRWRSVTFEVDRRWKGVPDDLPVVVRTASNSAACGYAFDRGRSYVVFANRNPGTGQLTTNLCALNTLKENAEGVMRELDRAKRSAGKAR